MNEELTKKLVQACKKMLVYAEGGRFTSIVRSEDLNQVEDILSKFPCSYFVEEE